MSGSNTRTRSPVTWFFRPGHDACRSYCIYAACRTSTTASRFFLWCVQAPAPDCSASLHVTAGAAGASTSATNFFTETCVLIAVGALSCRPALDPSGAHAQRGRARNLHERRRDQRRARSPDRGLLSGLVSERKTPSCVALCHLHPAGAARLLTHCASAKPLAFSLAPQAVLGRGHADQRRLHWYRERRLCAPDNQLARRRIDSRTLRCIVCSLTQVGTNHSESWPVSCSASLQTGRSSRSPQSDSAT